MTFSLTEGVMDGTSDMVGGKKGMECFMREWNAEVGWKVRVLYRGRYVCK